MTSRCRTMPSAWFNDHPSLPAAAREKSKYPWGEWGVDASGTAGTTARSTSSPTALPQLRGASAGGGGAMSGEGGAFDASSPGNDRISGAD